MKQRNFFISLLLVCLILSWIPTVQAQEEATPAQTPLSETDIDSIQPTPELSVDGTNFIGLDALTTQEPTLYGPFDAQYINIRLPAIWNLQPGAELRLNIDTFIGGNASEVVSGTAGLGGVISVQFNNVVIDEIILDQPGISSYTIPIPAEALESQYPDGGHSLAFLLDAGLHCQDDYQTNVIIRHSSLLYLPHEIGIIPTSVENIPLPIYQDLPDPESAVIVVPNQPSTTELQAAMITAASFGQLAFNRVQVSVIPESELPSVQNEEHLIFVGRADAFTMLANVELPIIPEAGVFRDALVQTDDGVLQYAVSPWNAEKVVLLISGNTDEGVLKASQSLSSDNIIPTNDPAVAVISEVKPLTATNQLEITEQLSGGLPLRFRLADLGYETRTAFGIGAHYIEYTFSVPLGSQLAEDGEIELNFAHSSLINYDVSGMLVRLNDQPLGSIRFSDGTTQRGQVELRIPRSALQAGPNTLLFSADLVPNTPCIDPSISGIWFSINQDTLLSLPLIERTFAPKPYLNLVTYAETLLSERTLNNLTMIMPDDDPAAWNAAAQFLVPLGNQTPPSLFSFEVMFDHLVPSEQPEIFDNRDIVIVGKPAGLQSLSMFNQTLPITFTPETNQPVLGNTRVVYRIPPDLSRGYLQFTRSPFDPNRVVLAILGSSDEGLQWATQALDLGRLRAQLNGTVAILNDEAITVEDTSLSRDTSTLAQTAIPNGMQPDVYRELPPAERPQWLLYGIFGSLGLMWLIMMFVGFRAIRARRQQRRRR